MSSVTEAELMTLYVKAQELVYIQIILEEIWHKHLVSWTMKINNAMAEGIINSIA